MVEAQAVVAQRERPRGERPDAPLAQHVVAQVGAEGEVIDPLGAGSEQAPQVADFEAQAPDQVSQHDYRSRGRNAAIDATL